MYCPKCGKENPDDARLCRFCSWVISSVSRLPDPDAKICGLAVAAPILGILSLLLIIIIPVISAQPHTVDAKPDGFDISAALVRGILSPISTIILPAIILGIVALIKINNSAGRLKGTSFAIAGVVIPVVMLPVLFMGSLMFFITQADIVSKQMERDVKTAENEMGQMFCKENLLKLGFAMRTYTRIDHNFPTPSKWCDILSNELMHLPETLQIHPELFRCKSAVQGPCNYAMNKYAENLGTNAPGDMVLLFETSPGWNQSGGPEILTTENHQGMGCNIMFVNGHVEWVEKEDLHTLRWTASDIP